MTLSPTIVRPVTGVVREVRVLQSGECRAVRGDGGTVVTGYAAKYDVVSGDLGGFREVIRPGAFARAISDRQDVVFLWMHHRDTVMARTASGTMTLKDDGVGLAFEARLADTSVARDLVTLIERGDVSSMSFSFRAVRDEWVFDHTPPLRTLIDVDLHDISAVDVGAYPDTSLALRSLECARANDQRASIEMARRRIRLAEAELTQHACGL